MSNASPLRVAPAPAPSRSLDQEIVNLREAGWLQAEIARGLSISRSRVATVIGNAGGVDHRKVLAARFESHLRRAQDRLDVIIARYRKGEDPQLIARDLHLDHRAVRRMVREHSTGADRTARKRTQAARQRPRFSDAQLLAGLLRIAHQLGWVPTEAEYNRLAPGLGLATSATIHHRFDGWRNALRAAGLEAAPRRRWALRWDAPACWRALESVADQLGDPPRYRRYNELAGGRDDLPSGGIVRDRLGLWSDIAAELTARRLAGKNGSAPVGRAGEPRPRVSEPDIRPRVSLPSRRARGFSDAQLLAGVRAVAARVGHTPSGAEYERHAKPLGLASLPTVYIHFGNWSGALEAAGFEPVARTRTYNKKWDEESCWRALESVADHLGDRPRYARYEQLASGRDDLPSGALLRQRLGPWSQVVAALAERSALSERRAANESQSDLSEGTYAAA